MNAIKSLPIFIAAAALFLHGCSQASNSLNPSAAPASRVSSDGDISQQDLLYVSNTNGEVTVYKYWQHNLIAVLTDFTKPTGECADRNGNVFITDSGAQSIVEYAHGGTKPIATLSDAPNSPVACSVDATTGNLAVASNDGTTKQGNIAIFPKATGTPTLYTSSQISNFYALAYDGSGNLLVSGNSRPVLFAWLPKSGSKLITVNVPGLNSDWKWYYVSGIQWDGKYFALATYDDYIFRESLIRGQVYFVGDTQIGNIGQFWIYQKAAGEQGTQIVGTYSGDSVAFWKYPAGGDPITQISHGIDGPIGVTISLRKK